MWRVRGFTYLMLLWWVAIAGIMLAAAGQSWQLDARRARDAELAWRGEQIRRALETYSQAPVAEGVRRLPLDLDELLEDERAGQTLRHLRRLWPDPVTGEAWGLLRRESDGAITGVYSRSSLRPVRAPAGVTTYAAWRFEVTPQ